MSSLSIHVQYLPVPSYEGYEVGDDGTVWSYWTTAGRLSTTAHPIQQQVNKQTGYCDVSLRYAPGKARRVTVHSLMMLAFVGPPPPGMEVRHLDGVKSHNVLRNLCYGTPVQNAQDREAHGTDPRGVNNGQAKLTDPQVLTIRSLYQAGYRVGQLAVLFGVSHGLISMIISRKRWPHI